MQTTFIQHNEDYITVDQWRGENLDCLVTKIEETDPDNTIEQIQRMVEYAQTTDLKPMRISKKRKYD